jgi:hypothetical protein
MRSAFARVMALSTRASTIADRGFESCGGIEPQRNVPRVSTGIAGWVDT